MAYVERAIGEVFEESEILVELICPSQLYPLNPWPVIESLEQTRRLLVVEEGLSFCALGAELIAQVHELKPGLLRRAMRLASVEHPIPSCGPLEAELLPNSKSIAKALKDLITHD